MPLKEFAQFLSPQRHEELYYGMIGCYLDESIDPKKQGLFAVGGILGKGRPVFELERKWESLRKRPEIDIEYFKASECQRGSKQFRKFIADPDNITDAERITLDGIWNRFLTAMKGDDQEHVVVYGMGVIQEDFYEVIKDPVALSVLGDDPYWFAYQSAMIEAAFAMKYINTGDSVAFVCDEDEEHSPIAHDVYNAVRKKNPNAAKYLGSFSMASDHTCEPLQAADAAIYEVRRALAATLGKWKQSLKWGSDIRWQFRRLSNDLPKQMWLIQYADKKYLEAVVNENKPGEPLDLDHFLEQEFNEDITY